MPAEKPTVTELIAVALSRADLRQRAGIGDLALCHALGAVSVSHSSVVAIFRLKYSDSHDKEDAVRGAYKIASMLARRERVRLSRRRVMVCAKGALAYWIDSVCRSCGGVGYYVIPGSPYLSDRPCESCNGAGKRPFPWKKRAPHRPKKANAERMRRWRLANARLAATARLCLAVLAHLERIEDECGRLVARKLGIGFG